MNSTNNRKNHNFQIAHFIAGACHTPDGAYAVLKDCLEERDNAIKLFTASELKQKARRIKADRLIATNDEVSVLEGQAEIAEIEAMEETTKKNIEAANAEKEFIEKCIIAIQPMRKYKDLSDPEAFEAAQREEWRLELTSRAVNHLSAYGNIPADLITTMRLHPDFVTIDKHITRVIELRNTIVGSNDRVKNTEIIKELEAIATKKNFELPNIAELFPNTEEPITDSLTLALGNVYTLKRD